MALAVENVSFSYEKKAIPKLILDDICLKVSKGTIYALLGPSGAGKTTLFKLVIGLCKPNSGSIHIFGFPPGTAESGVPGPGIGYMPQELSVQRDLTIFEILYYFGNLLGMRRKELDHQIDYLIQLFELPEKTRLIGNTSGGQQRRLSLAIAVLHKPRLLVLDEPTVGVDPVLCEKIWNLLLKLSRHEKTTIILTTHYIEETRRANVVGFMRRGEILEENTPKGVLRKYGAKSLEEAFLRIAKAQVFKKSIVQKWKRRSIKYLEDPLPKSHLTKELFFERKIIAIIHKMMIETRRNPMTMIFLFVSTFVTAGLLTLWFGKTPDNLTVAWVVDEQPFNYTPILFPETVTVEYLTNSEESSEEVDYTENENWVPYIPDILHKSLSGDIIKLVKYENISVAEKDLRTNRIYAIIHLNRNFSHCFVECDPFLNLGQEFVNNETVQCGTINLYIDPTNKVISSAIEYNVRDSLLMFQKEVAKAIGLSPHVVERPLEIIPIYGKIDKEDIFGVQDFIAPGVIFYVSHLFGYLPSLMAVAFEQGGEMYVRNYVSGVTALNMVSGQLIARFIFMALSNLINIFASVYLLGLQCHGSFLMVIAISWMTSIVGILHGTLFALLIPQAVFCLFCAIGMGFNVMWCGTVIWNLESQPYYIQWMQYLLPWALPMQSIRTIMAKENAPFHPFIWPGFAVTLVWIAISFIACVHFTKIKN